MRINRKNLFLVANSYIIAISLFIIGCEEDPKPPQEATAAFTSSTTLANIGEAVTFTDQSTGEPDSWNWTFEGGTPATSSDQNPIVIYSEEGTFDVTLTVTNQTSENNLIKEDYITVVKEVIADFTSNNVSALEGQSIEFTDASIGDPVEWDWAFEGGSPATSTEQNPVVVYDKPGVYTVMLTVTNGSTTNITTKERLIHITCEGNYCEPVFSEYKIPENVVYGVDPEGHKMIIYEAEGDSRTDRPIVVLMGGGGFGGTNLSLLEPLAENIVKHGAVVALIEYRVLNSVPQAELIGGQQDCRTAVRYLRKEAENLNISPDRIFIGGNGSGAFSALFHAYVDESDLTPEEINTLNALGGLEGEAQGNSGFSSEVAGVISLAGEMYVTLDPITGQDVPLFAIHGTADAEVPYGEENGEFGSKPITDKVRSVGLVSHLYTIVNGDHSAPRENSDDYILELMYFIRDIIE